MRFLLLFLFLLPFAAAAQTEPLWNYEYPKVDINANDSVIIYKIKGRKYLFKNNCIMHNNNTLFKIDTKDNVIYSLYKKRYLFISYYPPEQQNSSIGFSLRNLTLLDIIDLKSPYRKWHYDFKNLNNNYGIGVGLVKISEFNPKTGKIFFDIKFSIDDTSQIDIIPTHKKHTDF